MTINGIIASVGGGHRNTSYVERLSDEVIRLGQVESDLHARANGLQREVDECRKIQRLTDSLVVELRDVAEHKSERLGQWVDRALEFRRDTFTLQARITDMRTEFRAAWDAQSGEGES